METPDGASPERGGLNALIPFGDLDAVVLATEFLSKAPDQAARSFSNAYRASCRRAPRRSGQPLGPALGRT